MRKATVEDVPFVSFIFSLTNNGPPLSPAENVIKFNGQQHILFMYSEAEFLNIGEKVAEK
jgi:hypothetical protein